MNMGYRISFTLLFMVLPFWASAGCGALPPQASGPLPPGSTYIFHLPGIAGDSPFDRRWTEALAEGGAAHRVEICDWTCHHHWLAAMYCVDRHQCQAQQIADRIAARRKADPTGRVMITAESAGAGIAVYALQRLPRDVVVDDVVFISPATSPDLDLSAALSHVRGKMYYFDSPVDVLTLCLGTEIFGTIDQKRTLGAGLVGFHRPPHGDVVAYHEKLVEVPYNIAWSRWGYLGTHLSGMSSAFSLHVIAPLLVHDEQAFAAAEARNLPPPTIVAHDDDALTERVARGIKGGENVHASYILDASKHD
jgi:pimeloyl-ACP methyl ester carboxylesterase